MAAIRNGRGLIVPEWPCAGKLGGTGCPDAVVSTFRRAFRYAAPTKGTGQTGAIRERGFVGRRGGGGDKFARSSACVR